MALLVRLTVFLGAFLLFLLQPMLGRYILPWFGGTPAVWSVCLLFFQTLLVAGYGYAHLLDPSRKRWHIAVLAASLLWLPMRPEKTMMGGSPVLAVQAILAMAAGLPYLCLAATGPLVQRWIHVAGARSPYRLYALANIGSLAGLIAYPFVLEPLLPLRSQALVWSVLYGAYAVGLGVLAVRLRPMRIQDGSAAAPPLRDALRWVSNSACGSALLVATTNQMTQEVAVSPLLWVLPLALYLLTYIAAFAGDAYYDRRVLAVLASIAVPAACVVAALGLHVPLWAHLIAGMAALAVCGLICHGELALSKPDPAKLTWFYACIGLGGALGGMLVTLLAPRLFSDYFEYQLTLAAACRVLLAASFRSLPRALQASLILAVAVALLTFDAGRTPGRLARYRGFFGVLSVSESKEEGKRTLTHGRVVHGYQFLDKARRRWPTAYYGAESGVGLALRSARAAGQSLTVGAVGLGAGTIAAHGRPGDRITFYEISPDVDTISTRYFTFREDSKAKVEVVIGDARLRLEEAEGTRFDVLAIDAFSSDAVPAHLLTREAADLYARRLQPDGILTFHVTNQYVDLAPVVRGIGRHLGMDAVRVVSEADPAKGLSRAVWILLSRNPRVLQAAELRRVASPWDAADRVMMWTDDHINLPAILRF